MGAPGIDINAILNTQARRINAAANKMRELQILDAAPYASGECVRHMERAMNKITSAYEDLLSQLEYVEYP